MPSLFCHKCDHELLGATVICRQCGYNNALQRRQLATPAYGATAPSSETPSRATVTAKVQARFANRREATLIPFPLNAQTAATSGSTELNEPRHNHKGGGTTGTRRNEAAEQCSASSQRSTDAPTTWRADLKARVQQHRDRRDAEEGGDNMNAATALDPTAQLLVESALKRIRRAPLPTPATERLRTLQRQHTETPPWEASATEATVPETPVIVRNQDLAVRPMRINTTKPLRQIGAQTASPALGETQELSTPTYPIARTVSNLALQPDEEPLPMSRFAARADLSETLQPLASEISAAVSDLTPVFMPDVTRDGNAPAYQRPAPSTQLPNQFAEETDPLTLDLLDEETVPLLNQHNFAERESIETGEPAGIRWKGQPAPVWLRALAGICDLEAIAMLYLPFFGAYYTMDQEFDHVDYYVLAGMLFVVVFLYQLIMYSFNGRTFGMVIFGLRNVDVEDASRFVPFQRRLWQSFGSTVGLLCPPFNYLVTRVTGYQRGFGDALGQTLTLRKISE